LNCRSLFWQTNISKLAFITQSRDSNAQLSVAFLQTTTAQQNIISLRHFLGITDLPPYCSNFLAVLATRYNRLSAEIVTKIGMEFAPNHC